MEHGHAKVNNVTLGKESESGLAILVTFHDADKKLWVPLSQVSEMTRTKTAGSDSIAIAQWWLDRNEL